MTASPTELTATTSTTAYITAKTTSANSAPSCPVDFPSDSSCGVYVQYTGQGTYLKDISGTRAVDECVQFCIDQPTCNLFAHGDAFCELWSGKHHSTGNTTTWSWYELDWFCVKRKPQWRDG
ncbi:hypothetical protein FSARC_9689 [Fusarium sarcochroum]|uniref:Apple domain-containing protein n=1 Tax=Fusarium sarcochroum TaxID=1208366 RepID=A0A8H4TQH1_9HYPO|nr:hypothetical protein FSARC_9689 [Fusarium sarcochroum]